VPRSAERRIAVAIHDVEPATFEQCALIRDWLEDHGVDRATLLVIPARDLHPLGQRSPAMTSWLSERRSAGDSIAQHGFQHDALRRGITSYSTPLGLRRRRRTEFVGLDELDARRAVDAGWRVLKLAGIEPDGFVAPSYAYTPALRRVLPRRFRWWASLLRLYPAPVASGLAPARHLAPAWGTTGQRPLARLLAPTLIRAGGLLSGHTLRLDLHPAALEQPRQMLALERLLSRDAPTRTAVTYEQLLAHAEPLAHTALPGPTPV